MAKKRRKSKKPNLPQAAIDRARREAGLTEEDDAPADAAAEETAAPVDEAEASAASTEAVATDNDDDARRRAERAAERARRRDRARRSREALRSGNASPAAARRSKSTELDSKAIEELLAHPTKVVTQEQLQQEYGYVLLDLRNMFVLAAVLMVALVLLAQLI